MTSKSVIRVALLIVLTTSSFLLGRLAAPGFPRPLLVAGVGLVLSAFLLPMRDSLLPEQVLRVILFAGGVISLAAAVMVD